MSGRPVAQTGLGEVPLPKAVKVLRTHFISVCHCLEFPPTETVQLLPGGLGDRVRDTAAFPGLRGVPAGFPAW